MPTTEHTPAPWSVMYQNSRPREYGGGIVLWEVPVQVGARGNGGNVIAMVGMGGPGATVSTKEAVEANARLIAAAPKLAAALRTCLASMMDLADEAGYVAEWNEGGHAHEACNAARAALAEAGL